MSPGDALFILFFVGVVFIWLGVSFLTINDNKGGWLGVGLGVITWSPLLWKLVKLWLDVWSLI